MATIPSRFTIPFADLAVDYGRALGVGGFATVYQGSIVSTKEAVAVKVFNAGLSAAECERECATLLTLHHRHIVRFIGVWEKPVTRQAILVTELAAKGTLHDVVAKGEPNGRGSRWWTGRCSWP